jgi:hypothetical protein
MGSNCLPARNTAVCCARYGGVYGLCVHDERLFVWFVLACRGFAAWQQPGLCVLCHHVPSLFSSDANAVRATVQSRLVHQGSHAHLEVLYIIIFRYARVGGACLLPARTTQRLLLCHQTAACLRRSCCLHSPLGCYKHAARRHATLYIVTFLCFCWRDDTCCFAPSLQAVEWQH